MELTRHHRFAGGKPNALVIDIGANITSVTPIHDGYVLKKGKCLPAAPCTSVILTLS